MRFSVIYKHLLHICHTTIKQSIFVLELDKLVHVIWLNKEVCCTGNAVKV